MKVGFLHKVNTTPPLTGGAVHTYQVSKYLAQAGYKLLTLNNEQGLHFSKRYPRTFRGLRSLVAHCDVLYLRVDGRAGWELAALIPGLIPKQKPIIWEINATLEELKVLPGKIRLRDRLGTLLRPLAAKRATAALCVSAPLITYAHDLGIQQVLLTPNGSDPDLFSSTLKNNTMFPELGNAFRILWAGSTEYPWHDFQLLLDAATLLQSMDEEICFVVMGEPPKQMRQMKIPANLHFYPAVPYLEAPQYFSAAHVGLCLYRDIPWSRYGFFFSPLKLFDYGASGLPVIYSDIPTLDHVAQSFGRKIPIGGVEQLVSTVLELKNNPRTYARLASQGRKSILDYYNWNRVGHQTEEMLQRVTCSKSMRDTLFPPLEEALQESM